MSKKQDHSKSIIKEAIQSELQKEGIFDQYIADPIAGVASGIANIPRGMAGSMRLGGINKKIKRSTGRMKKDWQKTKQYATKKAVKMSKSKNPSVAQSGDQVKQNIDAVDRAMETALNKMQDVANMGAQNPKASKVEPDFEAWLRKFGINPVRLSKGPGNEYGRFANIFRDMIMAGINPNEVSPSEAEKLMDEYRSRQPEIIQKAAEKFGWKVDKGEGGPEESGGSQRTRRKAGKKRGKSRSKVEDFIDDDEEVIEGEVVDDEVEVEMPPRQQRPAAGEREPLRTPPPAGSASSGAAPEKDIFDASQPDEGMWQRTGDFIRKLAVQSAKKQAEKMGFSGPELDDRIEEMVPAFINFMLKSPDMVKMAYQKAQEESKKKGERLKEKGLKDQAKIRAQRQKGFMDSARKNREAWEGLQKMNRRNAQRRAPQEVEIEMPPEMEESPPNIGDTQPIPLQSLKPYRDGKTQKMDLEKEIGSFSDFAKDQLGLDKEEEEGGRVERAKNREWKPKDSDDKKRLDYLANNIFNPERMKKNRGMKRKINKDGDIQLGQAPSEDPKGVGQSATAPSEDSFGKKREGEKKKRPSAKRKKK